jgi:hypothetical protein
MSKGILLFALNSEMDYVKLAVRLTERIKYYLDLPVTIVTNSDEYLLKNFTSSSELFDRVIKKDDDTTQTKKFSDGHGVSERYVWKNSNRASAFDISPYDQTLVMDVDYVINSNFLLNVFNQNKDFLCFKESYDLAGWRNTAEFEYINQYSIPFYWATVFYFTKTKLNELFFRLVEYIRDNWEYYRLLYQINDKKYRNDYAFSIAIHILNGTDCNLFSDTIPGKMYYTLDKDILVKIKNNSMSFLVEKERMLGEFTGIKINDLDVHVMNKFSLLRAYDE